MRGAFLLCVVLAALCLVASSGAAKTTYVAPGGSDQPANGTAQQPWATIKYALGQVAAGDEIVVADGTYEGNIYTARSFASWVKVRAEHPYRAKLTNATAGGEVLSVYTPGPARISFEGFVFSNAHPSYTCPNGREENPLIHFQDAQELALRDCIIFGNNAPGTCNELLKINRGGDPYYPKDITIQGNVFYDRPNAGGTDLIDSVRPGELDILENIFFDRNAPGAQSFITLKRQTNAQALGITPRSPRFRVARNVFLNWSGETDQAFVQLGEDADPEVMISDALVENNLLVGNSSRAMAAPFQLKGAQNITVRANTIVGDLPSSAYGLRIGTEGQNPAVKDFFVYNNIWADPGGTMGGSFIVTYGAVDATTIRLDSNLYWNAGKALPAAMAPAPGADAHKIVADPQLPAFPAAAVLPVWDESKHAFASGQLTVRAELERLVAVYGALAGTSPARGVARADQMPADDILGRKRDSQPDLGAWELLAAPLTDGARPDGTSLVDGGARRDSPAAADAPASRDGAAPRSADGCSCRVDSRPAPRSALLALAALLLGTRIRRRRP